MRRGSLLTVALVLVAGWVAAEGVTSSPRPVPRPVIFGVPPQDLAASVAPAAAVEAPAETAAVAVAVPTLRPRPAPWSGGTAPATQASAPAPQVEEEPPAPRGLARLFGAGKPKPQSSTAEAGPGGSVCGVPAIKGEVLAPIKSKTRGCGVAEPVRVTSVSGVRLSQASTMTCPTAIALNTWVTKAVMPTFGRKEVVELTVAAHYICRPRNNVRGAKISEHGRGQAIDISGFVLKSGREVTVSSNYAGKIRKVHKMACGIFGTTLGPGSDGNHEDHIHMDIVTYSNGTYCR